jgi:hypothetical protein
MKLSDEHFDTFREQGYVVVESFYPEEKRASIAAAIRRSLPPWEEVVDDPPDDVLRTDFPFEDQFFNQLIVDNDLIDFVRQVLDSEEIHFRYAHNWARYPNTDPSPRLHRDNGNNTLLPPCDDIRYGQISSWYFPEEVRPDQAPMMIVPKRFGDDVSKGISLAVSAGTQMIFNTHVWHSATTFLGSVGQRYSVTRIYGRADHYWEGVRSYTNLGMREPFRAFIGSLSAKDRELFRFPPVGHAFYTQENLEHLEEQYPGWNARGEYS